MIVTASTNNPLENECEGFRSLELLVVVAIIGILASVGAIAYQSYIDAAQEEVTLEKAQKVDRAFTIDVLTIDNEFDGRTELATDQDNIDRDSKCIEYIDAAVKSLNSNNVNAYDKTIPYAVSMHKEAAWANSLSETGTDGEQRLPPLNVTKLKQGQLGMQCASACSQSQNLIYFISIDVRVLAKMDVRPTCSDKETGLLKVCDMRAKLLRINVGMRMVTY